MVGIIVTGHGHFASGITSSLDLIAGPQKNYVVVDFEGGHSTDDLAANLKNAYETLHECDGIIVFADLPGGSPFKVAVEVGLNYPKVSVLGGTNLPMLCEIAMARGFMEDADALVTMALNTGKEQVVKFEMKAPVSNPDPEDGEGI